VRPFYFCKMKYDRLTKQQFEELQNEFINFLATQSITASEWEGVLGKVTYLENISRQQMHLFHLADKEMKLISVKILNPDIDLNTSLGFNWFKKNWQSDFVEYLHASKAYTEDKNLDKFKLIQEGSVITKGELYQWFDNIIG